MTYLVITPFFPLPGHWWGGYVFDQVKAIINTGKFDKVIVLRTMSIGKSFDYECNGIKVYGLPALSMPSNILTGNPIQKWVNNFFLRKTIKRLKFSTKDIKYVHLHTFNAASYAKYLKSAGCITLLQHHDLNPYGINFGMYADKSWNINYIGRKSIENFKHVDCHLCISEACRDNLIMFPDVRKGEVYRSYISKINKYDGPRPTINNTYILYNGVDTTIFTPKILESRHKIFTIGCIGGFTAIKNQITLIKAVENIVKCSKDKILLKIIGTGPLQNETIEYIRNHHLSDYIIFEQGRDHENLAEFYHSIDLFCLPSYFEGFGCVFTEAYACGIPFMTCRHQGIEELVPAELKGKFLLENPFDYIGLSLMILNYMHHKYEFHLAKDYDITTIINNYCTWLKETY